MVNQNSMLTEEINISHELETLSKKCYGEGEEIDKVMLDMAKHVLETLKIERINIWLFNKDQTAIVSIAEYDGRTKQFTKDTSLHQHDFPTYFKALHENEIILAEDIYTHPFTKEFNELYSKPNDIYSLLDVPLRIGGSLAGVICYEKTGKQKKYSAHEISFCQSFSFLIASHIESNKRKAIQEKLEKALHEKDSLINEINHRVKNNLAILISLMRMSKERSKTKETKQLMDEYEQRIFSMLKIHDMLDKDNRYAEINLSVYLKELITEYKQTYPQISHSFKEDIVATSYLISTKKAIHVGLIVSEILLNSIKYASAQTKKYEVSISLKQKNKKTLLLQIGDNGKGFDFDTETKESNLGLPLIKDLIDQLDFIATYPTQKNCYYTMQFYTDLH